MAKDIVTYAVTINQIFPSVLPLGSGATTTVEFAVTPSDPAKYTPKSIAVYIDGVKHDNANVSLGSGIYDVTLHEGVDLNSSSAHQYAIYIQVDKAQSASLPLTVWAVQTQTIAQPLGLDPTRTTLGIGEEVNMSIIPTGVIVNDEITWQSSGKIMFQSGSPNTFTASNTGGSSSGLTEVVTATIGNGSINTNFTALAPDNITFTFLRDAPGNGGAAWIQANTSNAASFGAESLFTFKISPINVSFYNAEFSENIPLTTWTWPNGTTGIRTAFAPPLSNYQVNQDNTGQSVEDASSGLWQVQRLSNGLSYQNFSWSIGIPEQFLDDNNNWDIWLTTEQHVFSFQGNNLQGRVGVRAANTQTGGLMGPWENPGN